MSVKPKSKRRVKGKGGRVEKGELKDMLAGRGYKKRNFNPG